MAATTLRLSVEKTARPVIKFNKRTLNLTKLKAIDFFPVVCDACRDIVFGNGLHGIPGTLGMHGKSHSWRVAIDKWRRINSHSITCTGSEELRINFYQRGATTYAKRCRAKIAEWLGRSICMIIQRLHGNQCVLSVVIANICASLSWCRPHSLAPLVLAQ